MPSKPHPALQEITPDEWDEYSKKLLAYTIGAFSRYGGSEVILPGGYSADDVAQEITTRVLEGARRWDPEKHGELYEYSIRQIRSIISHCIDSWSGKHEYEVPKGDEYTIAEYLDFVLVDKEMDDREHLRSPEKIILEAEYLVERKELLNLVVEAATGAPELEALIEAYLNSDEKYQRRYIAKKLDITPSDVTNLWKKLKRRVGGLNLENDS